MLNNIAVENSAEHGNTEEGWRLSNHTDLPLSPSSSYRESRTVGRVTSTCQVEFTPIISAAAQTHFLSTDATDSE